MSLGVSTGDKIIGKCSFASGIHPPHRKQYSRNQPIRPARPGPLVVIPMSQHLGKPCQPTVEKGQNVTRGQKVGESDAFVSAAVFSPVAGKVKEIAPQPSHTGAKVLSVVIACEAPADWQPQPWEALPGGFDPASLSAETIVDAAREAGLVGQGGAAFPTSVKLKANPAKPIDVVLLNGCECEPYLTSDYRLMIESPATVVAGLELAMRAQNAERGIIAVEDQNPEAVNSLFEVVKDKPGLQVAICRTKYPQGGEKQLINAVLNRVVPTGGLPLDVGVVVLNTGTAASLTWACVEQRPLTERVVTVTGAGIAQPGNFRVPIGMLLGDLLEQAGGLTGDAAKVLMGGPMMGPAVVRLDVPILKGTSGITILTEKELKASREYPCIRCGRCVDHCPLGLAATKIAHAVKARDLDQAMLYDLPACVECGCCTYVCPSHIPLVQYMRAGKMMMRQAQQAARG